MRMADQYVVLVLNSGEFGRHAISFHNTEHARYICLGSGRVGHQLKCDRGWVTNYTQKGEIIARCASAKEALATIATYEVMGT